MVPVCIRTGFATIIIALFLISWIRLKRSFLFKRQTDREKAESLVDHTIMFDQP